MRLEGDAFLFHLANAREREYLEPSAVGEDGTVPAVELMQASHSFQHVESGTEVEVVGVAEDDLSLDLVAYVTDMACLDGAYGADGHEDGRHDVAMVGVQHPCAGVALRVVGGEGEFHEGKFLQR